MIMVLVVGVVFDAAAAAGVVTMAPSTLGWPPR